MCGNKWSSYWVFSNTHSCSFPTGSVWLELAESAADRVVLLQLLSMHDGAVSGTNLGVMLLWVAKWRRLNSEIYITKYVMIYQIYQFLGMEAKNFKFGMFCRQCNPSMAPGDFDIQPRNASWIYTCHLFKSKFCLYLHFGEPGRHPSDKTSKI